MHRVRELFERVRKLDPRWYQIACLSSLLVYGFFALSFEITVPQAALSLAVVLATQYACTKIFKLPFFEPKSALISGLSLCLLFRTNHLWLVVLAAVLCILPKFVVRFKGKHIFNPTNGAITFLILVGAPVWVSPGQWGNVAFFAFLMACLGGLVVMRSARADVAIAFLAFYLALLFGRSIWLGEPLTIPYHRLQSGALLLFTFFMISDPKTTPDSRIGRILFAGLVAFGAWYVQFRMFRTNGVLWSLFLLSPLVPVIDRVLRGVQYRWDGSSAPPPPSSPTTTQAPPIAAT